MKIKPFAIILLAFVVFAYGGLYLRLRYRHFFVHRYNTDGDSITLGEYNASFFILNGDTLHDEEMYKRKSDVVYYMYYPARLLEEVVRFKVPSLF